jgi:Ca2+-binding EF-hand superfamily protein
MSLRSVVTNEKKLERIARVVFNSIDKDGSGLIDIKELEVVMFSVANDLGLKQPSRKEIREVFNILDSDGSGNITFYEFKYLIKCILESLM